MTNKKLSPEDISNQFWTLLEVGRNDLNEFKMQLNSISKDRLSRFYWTYRYAMGILKTPPYVDHLDPKLSGDSTEDICMWIVAQGKDYYIKIIQNPEDMPFDIDDPNPDCIYLNLASRAYKTRFNEPFNYPDDDEFLFY